MATSAVEGGTWRANSCGLDCLLDEFGRPELPTVFVQGITGYQEPGLTNEQLAAQLGRQPGG